MTFQHFFVNRQTDAPRPAFAGLKIGGLAIVFAMAAQSVIAASFDTFTIPRGDGHDIQARVYNTNSSQGDRCKGLVILSHGAGGDERAMSYLGEDLSLSGWTVVSVVHAESGMRALRNQGLRQGKNQALKRLGMDRKAHQMRMLDIDRTRQATDYMCFGKPKYLIGHSMGAMTVMMEAMVPNRIGVIGEDRFDGYVALSPQGPGPIFEEDAWKDLKKPMLTMTGTNDDSFHQDYSVRTLPYLTMPPGCKWSAVIKDAAHVDFGAGRQATSYRLEISGTVMDFIDGVSKKECKSRQPLPGVTLLTK